MTVRLLHPEHYAEYERVLHAKYDSVLKRLALVNEALLHRAGARRVGGTDTWVWRDGAPASAAESAERLEAARGTDLSVRSLINAHRAAQTALTSARSRVREVELVRRLAG